MTLETLKQLIEIEFERTGTISQFKHEVFRLLDLYESDKKPISLPNVNYSPTLTLEGNGMVPYSELCGCNPKNGGSGICGCVIGNKMVPNVKTKQYNTPGTW